MSGAQPSDRCLEARERAIRVLHACLDEAGLRASPGDDGYGQVWARDSMITLLGATFARDEVVDAGLRASFESLSSRRTALGLVPNNVDAVTLVPNFQACADSGLWLVIGGVCLARRDPTFAGTVLPVCRDVLRWYAYQDVDDTGLVTMEEAADWEDLLAVRGKGLTVNVLHALALRMAAELAGATGAAAEAARWRADAERARDSVNRHLWYAGDGDTAVRLRWAFGTEGDRASFDRGERGAVLPRKRTLADRPHYLPYLTFRAFGEWFDSLGNLLAIVSGLADAAKAGAILDLIDELGIDEPFPVKAIHPPIEPGDADWRPYYRYDDLNLPGQYHNGGVWPFIGGFYVAALVAAGRLERAECALERLAEANAAGEPEWRFSEWLHGRTGEARGKRHQAWSAGMYLYACEAVRLGALPYFGEAEAPA